MSLLLLLIPMFNLLPWRGIFPVEVHMTTKFSKAPVIPIRRQHSETAHSTNIGAPNNAVLATLNMRSCR